MVTRRGRCRRAVAIESCLVTTSPRSCQVYCYNFVGLERYYAKATKAVAEGRHQVRMEFAYDGGGLGKGGTATLYIDGVAVGGGRIEQTEAFVFSADETCDVGDEYGSPVTTDYSVKRFTGQVQWVQIDLGLDDHNHLIRPDDRVNLAMALQ
jgi:hypothetical protein